MTDNKVKPFKNLIKNGEYKSWSIEDWFDMFHNYPLNVLGLLNCSFDKTQMIEGLNKYVENKKISVNKANLILDRYEDINSIKLIFNLKTNFKDIEVKKKLIHFLINKKEINLYVKKSLEDYDTDIIEGLHRFFIKKVIDKDQYKIILDQILIGFSEIVKNRKNTPSHDVLYLVLNKIEFILDQTNISDIFGYAYLWDKVGVEVLGSKSLRLNEYPIYDLFVKKSNQEVLRWIVSEDVIDTAISIKLMREKLLSKLLKESEFIKYIMLEELIKNESNLIKYTQDKKFKKEIDFLVNESENINKNKEFLEKYIIAAKVNERCLKENPDKIKRLKL